MYSLRAILIAVLGLSTSAAWSAPKSALRLHVILKGQGDLWPHSLVFSPDGKILASIQGQTVSVCLWDVAAGKSVAVLRHSGVYWVAFSPDGKRMASCGSWKIKIWDVSSFKEIATLRPGFPVYAIAFGPDGKILAGAGKGWFALWSVETKEELHSHRITFKPALVSAHPAMKKPVFVFSHRDRRSFTLVDALTGENVLSKNEHERPITCFALDGEEKTIASAEELAVRLWSRATGENVAAIEHPPDAIFSPLLRPNGRNIACALSPDGKILACAYEYQVPHGSREGGLRLYTVPDGKRFADLPQEVGITSLVFSPDGRLLATGLRRDIDLWNVPEAWRKKK